MNPIVVPYVFAMECQQYSDSSFELILDCIDTIDVKKDTMVEMYGNLDKFSSSFEGAKVYDIKIEDSITFATMEIPLPLVNDLKSDVKFTQSSNYFLEFLNGDLSGSSLLISLKEINGYDGTKNGGSEVRFNFHIKEVPCFAFGLKCGSSEDFEYALDRGLFLVESKSKELQENLNDKKTLQIISISKETKSIPPNNQTENTNQLTSTSNNLKGTPSIGLGYDGIHKITSRSFQKADNADFKEEPTQLVLNHGKEDVVSSFIPPPHLQMDLVDDSSEIHCQSGLELVFKASNGNPACVNPLTLEKLIQRGWTR